MTPELTVIVVTLNEEENLDQVLTRIRQESGLDRVEILVVDGGSTDRTVEIAARYGKVISAPRGRAQQLQAGLQQASGTWICFCHGDTLLPKAYGRAILVGARKGVVGGAFQPVYEPRHWLLDLLSLVLRTETKYLMFGDQAIFARRDVLIELGGVPQLALMEDVALALTLRKSGKLIRLPQRVITSSRRFLEKGAFRQLGLDIKLLFQYHILNIPAEKLASKYLISRRDQLPAKGMQSRVVGIMAKAPLTGRVKTRLGKAIGMDSSARVYRKMLDSLLGKLEGLPNGFQPVIMAASAEDQTWFQKQYPGWSILVQRGKDLGERLFHACQDLTALGAEQVLLISADTPELGCEQILSAFQILKKSDLVLGPNFDGGYYLIGQSECRSELYSGIPWSTSRVLKRTLELAEKQNLTYRTLPTLRDIDTIEDWLKYQREQNDDSIGEEET